jgi:hypothetical protein
VNIRMKNTQNNEPGDEFDRIMIPEFAEGNVDPDAASAEDEQPAPRAWWAGYRGKLLLYGAGTLVMVFLQSRG